jgi:signal transduction histidine kinase
VTGRTRSGVSAELAATVALAFVTAVVTVRRQPEYSLVGGDTTAIGLELSLAAAAGAIGLSLFARRRPAGAALALAAAAFALQEAAAPAAPGALAFGLGIVASGLAWPLAAAALAATSPRAFGRVQAALAIAAGAAGIGASIAWRPDLHGCAACPASAVAALDAPTLADRLAGVGALLVVAALAARAAMAGVGLVRATAAGRRANAPIFAAATAFAVGSAASIPTRLAGTIEGGSSPAARLLAAAALAGGAVALGWPAIRWWWRRVVLGRLLERVVAAPRPGALVEALSLALHDPSLELAFPLADGSLVDGDGLPRSLPTGPLRAVTVLERDGRRLGVITHRRDVLQDPADVAALARTVGLVIEHERAEAEVAARAGAVRASRRRLLEASDDERRHLEQDLHDGAQQRLVSLVIGLQLATPGTEPAGSAPLHAAAAELSAAIDGLRSLAHGLLPPGLRDEGLAAAVEDLQLAAAVDVEVRELPALRAPAVVEATAYLAAALAVEEASDGVILAVRCDGSQLTVRSWGGSAARQARRDELAERVAALDGDLVEHADGREVVLPCAS